MWSAANRKRREYLPICYILPIYGLRVRLSLYYVFLRRFKGLLAAGTSAPRKTDVCDFLSVYITGRRVARVDRAGIDVFIYRTSTDGWRRRDDRVCGVHNIRMEVYAYNVYALLYYIYRYTI